MVPIVEPLWDVLQCHLHAMRCNRAPGVASAVSILYLFLGPSPQGLGCASLDVELSFGGMPWKCLPGRAVQVGPMKPTLKAPGTKRLKLKYDVPLSNFAFKFNLRRYTPARRRT